jgi:hypothetical protein
MFEMTIFWTPIYPKWGPTFGSDRTCHSIIINLELIKASEKVILSLNCYNFIKSLTILMK